MYFSTLPRVSGFTFNFYNSYGASLSYTIWMVYNLSIFQHVVFGICRLIDFMVPDVPEVLEIKIKRERYLAKQALADTDTIMKVCNL